MTRFSTWFGFGGSLPALLLGVALVAGACESEDDKPAPGESDASGGASDVGGAPSASGGSLATEGGGEAAREGGAGGAGGAGSDPVATAGANAGGAPQEGGDCYVALAMNTSNAVDAGTPLTERCQALTYEGQMNFEIYAGEAPNERNLKVDFFENPVMGASIDLSKPYDFAAGKGGAASYMDAAGVWNADKGTVTIVKVEGTLFTVELTNVHFVVLGGGPDAPTNTGEFVANGTIAATSTPAP